LMTIAPGAGSYEGAPEERAWRIRFHLPPGMKADKVTSTNRCSARLIPSAASIEHPLSGDGPAAGGDVLEVELPASAVTQSNVISIQ
jgi:hypothetical protein